MIKTKEKQLLMSDFIQESKDYLSIIQQGLLNLNSTVKDPSLMSELEQAAHFITSGAAMLELNAIKYASVHLENIFQLLRDHREIVINKQLESLLISLWETLHELVTEVSETTGLDTQKSAQILATVKPIFTELTEYLNKFNPGNNSQENDDIHKFLRLGMTKLREILQLFKGKDQPEYRQKIQNICDNLAAEGEKYSCYNLSYLLIKYGQAIANENNSYVTLARILTTEIKQALELVAKGQDQNITPGPEMMKILPVHKANNMETKEDWGKEFDDLFSDDSPSAPLVNQSNNVVDTIPAEQGTDFNNLADLFEGKTPELDQNWQAEEILNVSKLSSAKSPLEILTNNQNEFADLLTMSPEENNKIFDEELESLLGEEPAEYLVKETDNLDFLMNGLEEVETPTIVQDNQTQTTAKFDLAAVRAATAETAGITPVYDYSLDLEINDLLSIGEKIQNQTDKNNPELAQEQNWDDILEEDNLLTTDLALEWNISDEIENLGMIDIEEKEKSPDLEESEDSFLDTIGLEELDNILTIKSDENIMSKQKQTTIDDELDFLFDDTETETNEQKLEFDLDDELEALLKIETNSNIDPLDELEQILSGNNEPEINNSEKDDNDLDIESLLNMESTPETTEIDELTALLTETEIITPPTVSNSDIDELEALLKSTESIVLQTEKTTKKEIAKDDDEFDLESLIADSFPAMEEEIKLPPIFGELTELLNQPLGNIVFSELEKLLDQSIAGLANIAKITPEIETKKEQLLFNEEFPTIPPTSNDDDDEWGEMEMQIQDTEKGQLAPKTASKSNKIEQSMKVPVKHLDNLTNLIGELVVNRNTLEQDQERMRQFLENLVSEVQQLGELGSKMQDLYERSLLERSLLASRQNLRAQSKGFDGGYNTEQKNDNKGWEWEEMDVFTPFHSLSQEVIELIVRVRESASDIGFLVDENEQLTRQLRQITTQLQEGLTRARMMPFSYIADTLPLSARKIARDNNKEIELIIEGGETLIDKVIIEKLIDPLVHLLTNAIVHGIENQEAREKAGKPDHGKIMIRAFHQGNETIIAITDDGAGINPERVKAKAIEKKLITPAQAKQMSRQQVYDLLFENGFSTKDSADQFGGRGVGMDVVRKNVTDLMRGTIVTDSTLGNGTTFTIRLPLTLSICKALCCISNRGQIAFPLDGVEDMLDIPKTRIQVNAEGKNCIAWRDTIIPFQPLSNLLRINRTISRSNVYGGNREDDMLSIIILRSAGNYLAVQVDEVQGEQEIVIKQIEGPIPKPMGIAGATVLGDGRVMAIADVLELIDISEGRVRVESASMWKSSDTIAAEPIPMKTDPMVLIIDDSITVRELLSMTFTKAGYRVEQARNGEEAWDKLRSGLPCEIIFCDVEMPKMNGLVLLEHIHKDEQISQIPIAMLTSRTSLKHQQEAAKYGAKGYFTKPYLEEVLLDAAQRMMKGENLLNLALLTG
jgi:chemotaxis protein histidine kinase CheA/ActR/RegA family two-component response regulator